MSTNATANTTPDPRPYAWVRTWWPTLALIGAITLARLIYLALLCPYALVEDEAHYWEWSRRLDLSYFSKGPGIAWLIRASTELVGHTELGVRFFAPICSGILALSAAATGASVVRTNPNATPGRAMRLAFVSALIVLLIPAYQLLALLMTIDSPYLACWAMAALFAHRALFRASALAWPMLGLAIGAAFLFKYTILLIVPGLILGAWMGRRGLNLTPAFKPLALLGTLLALAGLAPVIAWNASHDWATLHHLLDHLGFGHEQTQGESKPFDTRRLGVFALEMIGIQIGIIGPVLVLMAASAWRARRDDGNDPESPSVRFLVGCALPLLAFYLLVSFFTRVEGNWPIAAWVTLVVPAAAVVLRELELWRPRFLHWKALPRPRPRAGTIRRCPESPAQGVWHTTIIYGLVAGLAMLALNLLALTPVVGNAIPVGRLTSAKPMADHVAELVGELQNTTGLEPFVATQHYGRASLMAFYLHDPSAPMDVVCAGRALGGEGRQYDLWPDRVLSNPALAGRPAVLMGATQQQWEAFFQRVEAVPSPDDPERPGIRGDHKKNRRAFLGWRCTPPPPPPPPPPPTPPSETNPS